MRSGKKKSVVGDPINFRGMAHAPTNEAGVVALFSMVARDLGCYIQEIGTDFPDCIVRRDNGRAWEELAVEFEWDSRSFKDHWIGITDRNFDPAGPNSDAGAGRFQARRCKI